MSFGTDLSNEFHKLTTPGKYQEVELIAKLQDAFINLAHGKYRYEVEIIHGNRSLIEFRYNANWATNVPMGTTRSCELSDMLFVVFSQKHNEIRLMYMQNKKGESSRKFKADLVQLCLLKNRCQITSRQLPECVFGDRLILQNALLPSVGSYGVFYENNNAVDMAYYPASRISPLTAMAKTLNRKAQYACYRFGQIIPIGSYTESQGEETIERFANALVDMQIGTPITRSHPACGLVLAFLCAAMPHFKETTFCSEWGVPLENTAHSFSELPFACVIDADAILG